MIYVFLLNVYILIIANLLRIVYCNSNTIKSNINALYDLYNATNGEHWIYRDTVNLKHWDFTIESIKYRIT